MHTNKQGKVVKKTYMRTRKLRGTPGQRYHAGMKRAENAFKAQLTLAGPAATHDIMCSLSAPIYHMHVEARRLIGDEFLAAAGVDLSRFSDSPPLLPIPDLATAGDGPSPGPSFSTQ